MLAEDSQNVHLVEAANKGTEKDTEAETATWQISGITWKLNEEQSDLPEFHGGISEKTISEEFDENGEPVETSTKTWGAMLRRTRNIMVVCMCIERYCRRSWANLKWRIRLTCRRLM